MATSISTVIITHFGGCSCNSSMSGREFDDLEIEKADLNNDAPKQDQEDQTLPQGAAQPQESHASQQGES